MSDYILRLKSSQRQSERERRGKEFTQRMEERQETPEFKIRVFTSQIEVLYSIYRPPDVRLKEKLDQLTESFRSFIYCLKKEEIAGMTEKEKDLMFQKIKEESRQEMKRELAELAERRLDSHCVTEEQIERTSQEEKKEYARLKALGLIQERFQEESAYGHREYARLKALGLTQEQIGQSLQNGRVRAFKKRLALAQKTEEEQTLTLAVARRELKERREQKIARVQQEEQVQGEEKAKHRPFLTQMQTNNEIQTKIAELQEIHLQELQAMDAANAKEMRGYELHLKLSEGRHEAEMKARKLHFWARRELKERQEQEIARVQEDELRQQQSERERQAQEQQAKEEFRQREAERERQAKEEQAKRESQKEQQAKEELRQREAERERREERVRQAQEEEKNRQREQRAEAERQAKEQQAKRESQKELLDMIMAQVKSEMMQGFAVMSSQMEASTDFIASRIPA